MTPTPQTALGREVMRALDEAGPEGTARFSREAIRDVLALLILKHRLPPSALDAAARRMLGEFSAAAGLVGAAPADAQVKLDAYFERNPPSAELLARFSRLE